MKCLLVLCVFFASIATAQPTQISIIDFYGLQKISQQEIRKHISVKEGDSVLFDKEQLQNQILAIPGVKDADISTVCCDDKDGKWILFIGISEDKVEYARFNPAHVSNDSLPAEIIATYDKLMNLVMEAVTSGNATQDASQGHALLNYAPAKPVQNQLISYAQKNLDSLRKVLHNSASSRQREAAAWIIAYSPDKKAIVKDLISAVSDPDESVRNNATRALSVLASYANDKSGAGITIPAAPFIEMANSIVWTDRNKGVAVLLALTENRPTELMRQIKEGAAKSIIEMARWKNPAHALMNYVLLARLAGMPEADIVPTFSSDKRESSIKEMSKKILGN